jgi:hypothetical protein
VNGRPSRVLAILRSFGEFAARSGRRAEQTGAYSDRADRLNPNIVFSKRYSYQRRGHLTVSEVESYRLTLPRVRVSLRHARAGWTPAYLACSETVVIELGALEEPLSFYRRTLSYVLRLTRRTA